MSFLELKNIKLFQMENILAKCLGIIMKRDSIFYKLFKQNPALLFELVGENPQEANNYRFYSSNVKETEFRIDGVFLPPDHATTKVAFFAEFQFQKDEELYHRFYTELFMFLRRSDVRYDNWGGVLVYGSRSLEPSHSLIHQALLESPQTHRIYLDELGDLNEQPLGLALMLLTIVPEKDSIEPAKSLLERAKIEYTERLSEKAVVDLVSTIISYKFSTLTREEIEAMLEISLEESRVYRDAKMEGREEGREEGLIEGRTEEGRSLITRQLNRKVGKLPQAVLTKIAALSLEQLEELSEALLDFSTVANLEQWLKNRPKSVD
jgi:predicted transposase/invertase (TIGR01784 family)